MAQTVLPGGLTNVQNAFMKLQLQNNPEFAARYYPNVIRHPPSGPLYNVSRGHTGLHYPVKSEFVKETPLKSLSFEEMPHGPLHAGVASEPDPVSYAEFRTENVPYNTPNSVLDIRPTDNPDVYGETLPSEMYQGIKGGEDVPVTDGQSATIYLRPEMIKAYGTDPKAPRNEMVPRPSFWPDKSVDHVNQEDINRFIETGVQHEVSHNVSYLPEHKGSWSNQPPTPLSLTGQATNIDFNEMFPPAASEEAQLAIGRLGSLHQSGADLGAATEENPWGEPIRPYIGSTYPKTWVDNLTAFDQEEVYNRAKDIEKIKRQFKDWRNHPGYINNMNFLRNTFRKFANQLPPGQDKVSTYLKRVKPQVKQYLEKVSGQPSAGDWSPGVGGADLSPGGGYGQSPTGSDIAGTPFSRGGILGAF